MSEGGDARWHALASRTTGGGGTWQGNLELGSTALLIAALAAFAGCSSDSAYGKGDGKRGDGGAADGSERAGYGDPTKLADGSPRPCVDDDPRCGQPCGDGMGVCGLGLFCLDNGCTKECDASSFAPVCGAEQTCTPSGECIDLTGRRRRQRRHRRLPATTSRCRPSRSRRP